MKTLGQIAHDQKAQLMSFPRKWSDEVPKQKLAWEMVAKSVIDEYLRRNSRSGELNMPENPDGSLV